MADQITQDQLAKQSQAFIDEYLKLTDYKDKVEQRLEQLKAKVAKFSEQTNYKMFRSGNHLLKIYQSQRTSFPKANDPDRTTVEQIMRESKDWDKAITFDIIKLGRSFDKGKLPQDLMQKLEPYSKKEDSVRLSMREVKR
jgi:transcription initiation factor IIF auxiliary subunit